MRGVPNRRLGRRRGETRGGELKALDAETLAETQAMRFTPDAVTRARVLQRRPGVRAAAADKAGGVSLFRLLGPIHEPRDGADPARVFDFVGKHRTHAEATPCVGLAFVSSADGESVGWRPSAPRAASRATTSREAPPRTAWTCSR